MLAEDYRFELKSAKVSVRDGCGSILLFRRFREIRYLISSSATALEDCFREASLTCIKQYVGREIQV